MSFVMVFHKAGIIQQQVEWQGQFEGIRLSFDDLHTLPILISFDTVYSGEQKHTNVGSKREQREDESQYPIL